jgi:hypothetical protein
MEIRYSSAKMIGRHKTGLVATDAVLSFKNFHARYVYLETLVKLNCACL